MTRSPIKRRPMKGAYRALRIFLRVVLVLSIAAMAAFIYLRIYGIPKPLLQEMVRRANAAGIPVEVENISLTLRGWRAEGVRLYSSNPDDLDPVFDIDQVFFSEESAPWAAGSEGWLVDVLALGVRLNPSLDWGVDVPEDSKARRIQKMDVTLRFLPDKIVVSDGSLIWMGCGFKADGEIIVSKGKKKKPSKQPTEPTETASRETTPTFWISRDQFTKLEKRVEVLSISGMPEVAIDFQADLNDLPESRVGFSVHANDVEWKGVSFTAMAVEGNYSYPVLSLSRAILFRDRLSLQVDGTYDFTTKTVHGSVFNTLQSMQILGLLPASIDGLLEQYGFHFEQLPRLDLDFGPAPATNLWSSVAGSFSIRNASYQGVDAELLRGNVNCKNGRTEVKEIQAILKSRPPESSTTGSGMGGGSVEGRFLWDQPGHEFALDLNGNFDPNLLTQALSRVRTANKVITRFQFKGEVPQLRLEMGADTSDWHSLWLRLQASASDTLYQGVMCNTLNVAAAYDHGRLRLDPLLVMQEGRFVKGTSTIDFREHTVEFDAQSTMNPEDVEDMIHPGLNLFGHQLMVSGDVRVDARGRLDWETMQSTDFEASVEAKRFEVPVAAMDNFKSKIICKGPVLQINGAEFGLYDGNGHAEMSIRIDPTTGILPYTLDLKVVDADFKQCLEYLSPEKKINVSGIVMANALIDADFSTNFFSSANGKGSVKITKGQLADLPLIKGFSRLIRLVVPGFSVFSITSLRGDYAITDGVVSSENISFGGDIINAEGRGSYRQDTGFDAYIRVQILKDSGLSKVVRVLTDPLMKFLEIKLEGPLGDPSWRLEKFPENISNIFGGKKE